MLLTIAIAEILLLALGLLTGHPFLAVGLGAGFLYLILAYRSPTTAWALVWLAFPFSIETLLPGGVAMHVPTEPMMLLALLAWGSLILAGRPFRLPRSELNAPLGALAVVALLSAVLGSQPLGGIKACIAISGYVLFGYVFQLVAWDGPSRVERFVPWMVGAGALWGLYGTIRVAAEGLSLQTAYGAARPFFVEHGAYAAYLAMILPMALIYTLERRGSRRAFYAVASVAMTLGIVFSLTRAAWVSLGIVLPATFALWAWWRRSVQFLAPAAVLAVALALVLPMTRSEDSLGRHVQSITETTDPSNVERLNRWVAAVAMAEDHPLLGVGVGAYPDAYRLYRRKIFSTELVYQRMGAHSEPFRLIAETGILGLLAALLFLFVAFRTGIRAFFGARDPRTRAIVLSVLAGIGTFCLHGFFRTYFDLEKVAVPFWAGLGILAAARRGTGDSAPPWIEAADGEGAA